MSVNPTESNDLEVDIVLPNFDLNVFEKEADEDVNHSGEEHSSQEIDNFIHGQKSKNTVKKTKPDWQRFDAYCQGKISGCFDITNIPAPDLDKLLCSFFKDLRKKDGSDYEPDTVSSFQKSIQRHITEQKLPFNILKDDAFSRSRSVLAAKRKSLVKEGRGNKPNASRELTDEEEAKLFETGEFGNHNPLALQRTLWWFLSMYFGFRARDESRKLCWGDIVLDVDAETGREVLVWTAERGSKTRQGLEGGHQRQFCPKAFATGTNRCPVLYYKLFKARRPQKANSPESPFYLAVNHQTWRQSQVWYKSSPLGKNEIGKFMSTAAKNAGLAAQYKKISNHSVRKTSISRLLDAGVPENFVMQLSGHKNLQSLSSYKSASITHQRHMSDTLSRGSMSNNGTTSIREQIFHTSLFSAESQARSTSNPSSEFCQGQSFFAGATISTMNNCVFNIIPSSLAKRPRIDDQE